MEPLFESNGFDYEKLNSLLPVVLQDQIFDLENVQDLVLDLGKPYVVRYLDNKTVELDRFIITDSILAEFETNLNGEYSYNNRCGIDGTLHRVSRIEDKLGRTNGFTVRLGRLTKPKIALIADLLDSGKSILMVGKPGCGKTSLLRQASAYLADNKDFSTIVVDKTNEIGGDSRIPHIAIGDARRMSVPVGSTQASILLQAVENHSPKNIIVDEISNREEAAAVQTISERGVQVVATVHGPNLASVVENPQLKALLGNVKSVTLSTEEAKRRDCKQTVLEREFSPAFDVVVEVLSFDQVAVHHNVEEAIDSFLTTKEVHPEYRVLNEDNTLMKF